MTPAARWSAAEAERLKALYAYFADHGHTEEQRQTAARLLADIETMEARAMKRDTITDWHDRQDAADLGRMAQNFGDMHDRASRLPAGAAVLWIFAGALVVAVLAGAWIWWL